MAFVKKKLSPAARRLRGRSNVSFLFVLFFFGLFCIIFVMETILPPPKKVFRSDNNNPNDEDIEDYSSNEDFNFDISFDDKTIELKSKKILTINNNPLLKNTSNLKNKQQLISTTTKASKSTRNTNNKNNISIETDWQQVTGSTEKFYVYSAYFVNDHIKVIGATKTRSRQIVECRFYDNQTHHYSTVSGKIKSIRENWNMRYSACFIICNLPSKETFQLGHPTYVSVSANLSPSSRPSNILKVQYASEKLKAQTPINNNYSPPEVNFSLCVKPIYLNYDNVLHFLETIEFHRIMGVEHFTFFNHSIGASVGCIMNQVYNSSLISILPWSLPFVSQKEIRTEGIFAALNDCVYRHRGTSKYLVIVDLDETIVPRKTNKYLDLIQQLNKLSNTKKVGAYSFQNAFFYLQFDDDLVTMSPPPPPSPSSSSSSISQNTNVVVENNLVLAQAVSKKLLMLRKTRRRARFNPHKERSKYICNPNKVIEAGNHFVWEMEKGYYTLSVPTHMAALHHYRVCEFGGSQCIKNPSVVDKTVQNFSNELILAVTKRLEEASTKCNIDLSKVIESSAVGES